MEKIKAKKVVLISSLFILIILILALSYALSQMTLTGKKNVILTVKELELSISENESDVIKIEDAIPVSDEEGKLNTPYKFSITNEGKNPITYAIYLEDDSEAKNDCGSSCEVMDHSFISYQLKKDGEVISSGSLESSSNLLVENIEIKKNVVQNYELVLWLNMSADNSAKGKYYFGRIRIDAKEEAAVALVDSLLTDYTNDASITSYTEGDTSKMYTFHHDAGSQQSGWTAEELTDYRYIGANPNNYVTFNDEMWRIIGIFTVENEQGEKEKRIKIVREASIGTLAWDSTSNEWGNSSLQQLLNSGDYYNRTGSYISTGLNSTAKSQIAATKWYLGGSNTSSGHGGPSYYAFERGTQVYTGRSVSWVGEVGLIYPSDYAYTYAYGVNDSCYSNGFLCGSSGVPSSGWLFNSTMTWTISALSNYINRSFIIVSTGNVGNDEFSLAREIRPSVYLNSDVTVVGGTGSSNDPFVLS